MSPKSGINQVVCNRPDRLGARLRNLIGAMRLSKDLGFSLQVNWPPSAVGLGATQSQSESIDGNQYWFFDLYDQEAIESRFPNLTVTHQAHLEFEKHWSETAKVDSSVVRLSQNVSKENTNFYDPSISAIYYDLARSVSYSGVSSTPETEKCLFDALPLNVAIKEVLTALTSVHDLERSACLHVRRGDLLNVTKMCQAVRNGADKARTIVRLSAAIGHFVPRYAPYVAFQNAIASLEVDCPLLVFSDCRQTKARFRAEYSDRVVDYETTVNKYELTSLQRDFVEFLLITKCERIYGTESAFVDFAARVAGKHRVNVLSFCNVESLAQDLREIFFWDQSSREILSALVSAYLDFFERRGLFLGARNRFSEIMRLP